MTMNSKRVFLNLLARAFGIPSTTLGSWIRRGIVVFRFDPATGRLLVDARALVALGIVAGASRAGEARGKALAALREDLERAWVQLDRIRVELARVQPDAAKRPEPTLWMTWIPSGEVRFAVSLDALPPPAPDESLHLDLSEAQGRYRNALAVGLREAAAEVDLARFARPAGVIGAPAAPAEAVLN